MSGAGETPLNRPPYRLVCTTPGARCSIARRVDPSDPRPPPLRPLLSQRCPCVLVDVLLHISGACALGLRQAAQQGRHHTLARLSGPETHREKGSPAETSPSSSERLTRPACDKPPTGCAPRLPTIRSRRAPTSRPSTAAAAASAPTKRTSWGRRAHAGRVSDPAPRRARTSLVCASRDGQPCATAGLATAHARRPSVLRWRSIGTHRDAAGRGRRRRG